MRYWQPHSTRLQDGLLPSFPKWFYLRELTTLCTISSDSNTQWPSESDSVQKMANEATSKQEKCDAYAVVLAILSQRFHGGLNFTRKQGAKKKRSPTEGLRNGNGNTRERKRWRGTFTFCNAATYHSTSSLMCCDNIRTERHRHQWHPCSPFCNFCFVMNRRTGSRGKKFSNGLFVHTQWENRDEKRARRSFKKVTVVPRKKRLQKCPQ